jgi:hypothetical protein
MTTKTAASFTGRSKASSEDDQRACHRDSGGAALSLPTQAARQQRLFGVLSRAVDPDVRCDARTIFTSVAAHRAWIDEELGRAVVAAGVGVQCDRGAFEQHAGFALGIWLELAAISGRRSSHDR